MLTSETIYQKIFASYMALPGQLREAHDSKIRHPQTLIQLARRLDLLPSLEKTIRVTGSKGKGTVSHFIARMISAIHPQKQVALLISPEELIHRDRMRINGQPISEEKFVAIYRELEPHLLALDMSSLAYPYLSPSGVFLLLALLWFKREKVDYFVLETGRGVRFDEAGHIPSALAVVTSILAEHLDKIGPTILHVAHDKLAIAYTSNKVVLDADAYRIAMANEPPLCPGPNISPGSTALTKEQFAEKLIYAQPTLQGEGHPYWIARNHALAWSAVHCLLPAAAMPAIDLASPSFLTFTMPSLNISAEGLIALSSLDTAYYSKLLTEHDNTAVILSIPDDKELQTITAYFADQQGIMPYHVTVSSPGLSYALTRERFGSRILFDCSRDDDDLLIKLRQHPALVSCRRLALFGTQSFLRVVKRSLAGAKTGDAHQAQGAG